MSGINRTFADPMPDLTGAACKGHDPHMFIDSGDNDDAAVAKKICRHCPVRRRCLDWALDNTSHGVWGAMTAKERDMERYKRRLRTES